MRMIDADKLKNRLITLHEAYKECNSYPMRNKHRWYANMIEELDKQPTVEMAEDCISKEAVKQIGMNQYETDDYGRGFGDAICEVLDLPSVTPSYNSVKTELEPCEDCISREEALDILDDFEEEIEYGKIGAYSRAREQMCNLPSVQPQNKNGEWIRQDDKSKRKYLWLYCSECGAWIREETNFCSECGADMRGG